MVVKKKLSKTPRHHSHSRKVQFSIAMREKISKNWIDVRKNMRKKPKKKRYT